MNIFTTGEPKLAHMYYVLYRLICNLVPLATDMIYGRHLGFQNYPILIFWQCNPVNLHPNLASTQHTFAKDVLSLCWKHVRTMTKFKMVTRYHVNTNFIRIQISFSVCVPILVYLL